MMFVNIFNTVIEISITTSLIIALILIASPITKKTYSAKWRYFVWLIIAVRLIIPLNINLPQTPVTLPIPSDTIIFRQPTNVITEAPKTATIISINTQIDTEATTITQQSENISVMELLTYVWLVGVLVFILYHLITYLAFKKQIKRWGNAITNENIIVIFNRLCVELRLRTKPQILLCKKVNSPMMFGFVKPVLLLPTENYNASDLEVILKHELIHFSRKDLWYKLVLLFANAIHWFNPLVYLMLKSANVDVEISCDNEVVKNSDIAFRKSYSQTILNVLHNEKLRQSALSTHFNGGKQTLKNRFENIFDMGKKRNGIFALCVVLMITVVSGFFVACVSDNTQGKTVSELLYSNKTDFVGDNSKVVSIVDLLSVPSGIKRDAVALQTENEPYGITINYTKDKSIDLGEDAKNTEWINKNVVIMFSLIQNVDKITITMDSDLLIKSTPFEITRVESEKYFGSGDLREFAKTEQSFNSFLAKVDAMTLTTNENIPFKGLELYVWKNEAITGNNDTYFTLLLGTNRNKTEDEIYDLGVAVNGIDKINELLAGFSQESQLFIVQMNEVDFTKEEMLKISEQLSLPTDIYSKSIGLYRGLSTPINDVPVENVIQTMDDAIHGGLIDYSRKAYLSGEFNAEWHTIIDFEEANNYVTVYALIATQNFQFKNALFTTSGGSGVHPVVIKLLKDDNGAYKFLELKEPMDGGMWEQSIKEMYPERLWDKISPLSTKFGEYKNDFSLQITQQAEQYLKSIGRNAEIILHGETGIVPLDIDVNFSNGLDKLRKYDMEFNKYPDWIGTQEFLENGERFIYETYLSQDTNISGKTNVVSFKKTNEKGNVIDQFEYKFTNGKTEKIVTSKTISINELPKNIQLK